MKTLAISNSNATNFKALLIPKDAKFTSAQEKTLEDIKQKISQKPLDTIDFYALPRKNDFIELFVINNNHQKSNEELDSFEKQTVGMFNEDHPFETDPYSFSVRKAQFKNSKAGTIFSLAILSGFMLILSTLLITMNKSQNKEIYKQIVVPAKDTLSKAPKDTLDLTAKLLKK